jgi:hypothetical protein
MKAKVEYAIYKGDTFLFMGTAKECAEHFGIKANTIYFIATKTYKERMMKMKGNNYKYAISVKDGEEVKDE